MRRAHHRTPRGLRLLAAALLQAAHGGAQAELPDAHWAREQATEFARGTYLVELVQGSNLTVKVRANLGAGFEMSGGGWLSFRDWYHSRWTDMRATWMTEVSPNLGVLWGASTGEAGEKYRIDPSVKLGFVYQRSLGKRALFSLRAATIFGGRLRERACTADYGEIGGVQQVNCRLAATPLDPAETLKYLYSDKPADKDSVTMQYTYFF